MNGKAFVDVFLAWHCFEVTPLIPMSLGYKQEKVRLMSEAQVCTECKWHVMQTVDQTI